MDDPTSLLFGLESFRVVQVVRVDDAVIQVVIETIAVQQECPDCGVLARRVKQRPLVRLKDLPVAGQQVIVWWRKRRLVCAEMACRRSSFTQTAAGVPARSRLTDRLRIGLAQAIAGSNRAVSEVAAEYRVAWHTASCIDCRRGTVAARAGSYQGAGHR